uniref:Uncharacterized protein n=1 Tax=Arundo donax TaxID=35708 RepID=A0A0A9GRQ7_ARUDO
MSDKFVHSVGKYYKVWRPRTQVQSMTTISQCILILTTRYPYAYGL